MTTTCDGVYTRTVTIFQTSLHMDQQPWIVVQLATLSTFWSCSNIVVSDPPVDGWNSHWQGPQFICVSVL